MKNVFHIITALASIVLITLVLVQSQGSGLGASLGGDSGSFRSKRGAEKIIFNATILFSIVFVLSIVLGLLARG